MAFDSTDRRTWTTSGIKRGDIFIVVRDNYGTEISTKHGRPAVVVSNEKINNNHKTVEVVYMTSKVLEISDTHVPIKSYSYNNIQSTLICEQIDSVDMSRLVKKVGSISDDEMKLIDVALAASLSLDTLQQKDDYVKSLEKYVEDLKEYANNLKNYYENKKAVDTYSDEADDLDINIDEIENIEKIKLETELNVYKQLYSEVLEKLIK
jgi:mRNA interferase MazF